ncbi:MAG: leucine-rich repeat protein, partial [bacterium]|nr:leucine-rich repeat protein [bacterium]
MNNKIKKPVLFLLCLSATLATLSACGKKTTASTTAKPTTTAKTTTAKKETTKKLPTGNPRVFFIVDGEIYQEVEYLPSTAAIVEPEIPQKAGYNIAKWSDYTLNGYDLYVFAMYFKSNTTYKVEYYLQNLENDEYTLKSEDTQSFTTTPDKVITPDINTYDGFNCINAETEYMLDEDSSKNTIKIYYDRIKYDINIDLDNGSSNLEYSLKYGATIPAITTPIKEGYEFSKFTSNGADIDLNKPVSQSLDIKANYTANTNTAYKVKYYQENKYDDGYTLVEDDTQNLSGTTDTDISITVDPNKYAGFSINQDKTISSGKINGDGSLELAIYYNRNKYNITYKYGDGETLDVVETVKYDALATKKEATRLGYTFNGWTNSETSSLFTFDTEIEKDYTFIASYTPNSGIGYKVNVYYESANDSEYKLDNSYTYTATTGDEITVEPTDYDNSRIFKYNEEMSNPTGIVLADGSLELNLYFKREVYTLRFLDRNNSELIKTVTIKHGQIPSEMPEEFVKVGYTMQNFADQTLGGSQSTYSQLLEFIYSYNGSWGFNHDVKITYTANSDTVYKIRVYYENIEDDNYSFIEELTCYGTTDDSITPEGIENFIFDHASGYTEEDGAIIKGDGSTVIKAYYKRARYNISFDTNVEGVTVPTIEGVKYGAKISKPTVEKVGYTLNYWRDQYSGNEVDFDTYIVEYSTQLDCYWTPNTNTKFIVKHFLQNIDDDEYTLYDEDEYSGTSDSSIYYGNYVINIEGANFSSYSENYMIIEADGSSVLELYYYRKKFDIYLNHDEHIELLTEKEYYNLKYGAKINIKGLFDNHLGFEIDGIYDGSNVKLADNLDFELTVTSNISIYLKSKVVAEMEPFYFNSTEDECIITGYRKQTPETIVIPDIVTSIQSLVANNGIIKKVALGKNLKKIGYEVFYNCPYLSEIEFNASDKLEEIGERSFYGCDIKTLTIPKGVKKIAREAFYENENLDTVVFADNSLLEEIGNQAFYDANIKEIALPLGIKKIGENVFDTLDMEEFVVPNTLEEIGEGAFYSSKFKVLTFMEDTKLTEIPNNSFYGTRIDKVIIPSEVTKIGEYAFSDCYIKELIFENGSLLEEIDDYAFCGENRIRALNLPNNLKTIGMYAFNQYARIGYVKVNSKLLEIQDCAFEGSYPNIILNYSDKTFVIGESTYGYIALEAKYIFNGDENDQVLIDTDNGFVYKIVGEEKELLTYIGNDREVVIPNGVTKICANAFYSNKSIISADISDTVTEIGDYAFYDCDSLASVNIGSGVTTIANYAFYSCNCLVEVNNKSALVIEKGISSYGYAGYYAINITTDSNFSSTVSYDDRFIKYVDNDDIYLVKCIIEDEIDEVIIDDDYTIIYDKAFEYKRIKKIVIGSGVKTINNNAFNYAYEEELVFKENSSLTYIGRNAFYNNSNLKNLIIPKSVKTIDEAAFYNCSDLETLEFEENSELENINNQAFAELSLLKEIVLPDSLATIGSSAFYDCYNLESVTFGANLTSISENAFGYCASLKDVVFTSETLESIGALAFTSCVSLIEFELGENVVNIDDNAFFNANIYSIYNKSSLTLVKGSDEHGMIALKALDIYSDIADKKLYVEDDFLYYKELDGDTLVDLYLLGYVGTEESITINKDVTIIGASAFRKNDIIKNVTFESGSKLRVIEDYAFESCNINVYELPSTLERVGDNGLTWANNAVAVDGAYYLGNSENPCVLLIGIENSSFSISENCRVIASYSLTWVEVESLTIPDSVVHIGREAFANSTIGTLTLLSNISIIEYGTFREVKIDSIVIPKNVTRICQEAFYLSTLQEITFEAGSKLTRIDDYAFSNCDNLVSIEFPSMLEEIGLQAFCSCDALETITFADNASLKTIGEEAFYDCNNLTSFEFVDSLEVIGTSAFYSCNKLGDLVFGENSNLTTISKQAFYGCESIQTITMPGSLVTIDEKAFYNCSGLETVTFPSDASLTTIANEAFRGCNLLTSFTFPDSLEYIGKYAFYAGRLNEIVFGENSHITTIDEFAFYSNINLDYLALPKSLKYINSNAFCQCTGIESITVAEGSLLEYIGEYAFYYCHYLETV